MKRLILLSVIGALFLMGCTSPPPVDERAEAETSAVEIEATEPPTADGPVATVAVVLGNQSSGYPEPEVQAVAEGYPEPAVQVVEVYPEPVQAEPTADVVAETDIVSAITGDGDVEVLFVSARLSGDGTWNFAVTLEHADNGWEDYADGWDVVLPSGVVIKPTADSPFTRLLTHPHDNEQPFTRSQAGIAIPADVTTVYVRGHELVDGYSAQVVEVDLTADGGDRFEVIR